MLSEFKFILAFVFLLVSRHQCFRIPDSESNHYDTCLDNTNNCILSTMLYNFYCVNSFKGSEYLLVHNYQDDTLIHQNQNLMNERLVTEYFKRNKYIKRKSSWKHWLSRAG